jgi:hypothetical protein
MRPVKMRVDRHNSIECSVQQSGDNALADWLSAMEDLVLPHVRQVGRNEDEALGACSPPGVSRKQKFHELGIGSIKRPVYDRDVRRGWHAGQTLSVWKDVRIDQAKF